MKKILIVLCTLVLLCGCGSNIETDKEKLIGTWIMFNEETGFGHGLTFNEDGTINSFNTHGQDVYDEYTIDESGYWVGDYLFEYKFNGDKLIVSYDGSENVMHRGNKDEITSLVKGFDTLNDKGKAAYKLIGKIYENVKNPYSLEIWSIYFAGLESDMDVMTINYMAENSFGALCKGSLQYHFNIGVNGSGSYYDFWGTLQKQLEVEAIVKAFNKDYGTSISYVD